MSEKNGIVAKGSEGYGYKYASLSDIVKQGYTLPKMKTASENNKEYVFYKDGEDWIRGAEIVIPESKGMNRAQLYGSALTYARRYTAQLALCLAADDDEIVEDISKDGERKSKQQKRKPKDGMATKEQIEFIAKNGKLIADTLKSMNITSTKQLTELTEDDASDLIGEIHSVMEG